MKRFNIDAGEFAELLPLYALLDNDALRPKMLYDYLILKMPIGELINHYKTTKPTLYSAANKMFALKVAYENALVRHGLTELDIPRVDGWVGIKILGSSALVAKIKESLVSEINNGHLLIVDRL